MFATEKKHTDPAGPLPPVALLLPPPVLPRSHHAALPLRFRIELGQVFDQPKALIGDEQFHTLQTAPLQLAQERRPVRPVSHSPPWQPRTSSTAEADPSPNRRFCLSTGSCEPALHTGDLRAASTVRRISVASRPSVSNG